MLSLSKHEPTLNPVYGGRALIPGEDAPFAVERIMTMRIVPALCLVLGGLTLAAPPAGAQQQTAQRIGHDFSPANRAATEARIGQLRVHEGDRKSKRLHSSHS